MKKQRIVTRILATAFVGLLMILGMTGVSSVIAADEATAADIQLISETAVAPDVDLPTNDELFTGYLEKMFYGNNGVSTFAVGNNMAGARLTGDAKLAYDALVPFIKEIAKGGEITFPEITLGVAGAEGIDKIVSFAGLIDQFDSNAVMNALLSDYPYEMYWYDKTTGCQISGSTDGNNYIKSIKFSFNVADNYQIELSEGVFGVNTAKTFATSTAVEYATSLVNENADKSDYEKLVAYRDAIMDLVEYNDVAAESGTFSIDNDPWQLVYVFDQDEETNVVCEGYSKAFQYLCDLSTFSGDVSCYSVSGTMSCDGDKPGGHMWNIVTIGGANYLVDVTNSDGSSVGSDGTLFLAGTNGNITDGYIFTNTAAQSISFVYDEYAITFWGNDNDSILKLADTDYSASTLQDTVYVSSTGDDSNAGTSNAPVKTIEQALELVGEGGTIQIVDSASSKQLSTDEPLCIIKKVTITGGELTLNRAGIVLGADVTFKDININFISAVRNAVIANGYTLSIDNVNGNVTFPIHLFCGGLTGYADVPASGTEGRIIISGTKNYLGNIFAGSFAEPIGQGDGVPSNPGSSNNWTYSSVITISSGAGGTIGDVYAHGATEPRGEGDGASMSPNSTNYTVTGAVTINLSGSKPAKVYGTTGGSSNADVVVTGGGNLISGLTLNNLASLKVASGTFQPEALNENVDVTISQGAELDLSTVIEDGSYFRVEDFVGGGTLALGREDKLCIMGTVSGTTEFQVTDDRPNDKRTSGTVRYSFEYIDMSWADGDCEFTFVPHELQVGTTLEHSYDESGNVWITSAAPVIKPDSFEVLTDTYTILVGDYGLEVPVSCDIKEDESFSDISLDSVTISKDGAEAVVADKNDDNGVYYSVASLGFSQIFAEYNANGDEVICIYCDDAVLEAGVYTINISVVLADNSTATETITLYVRGEGEHVHSWSYSASGATITATCMGMIGTCGAENKSITVEAPVVDTLTYNGTAKEATVSGSIDGVTTPTIVYTAKDGSSLTDGKPVNAGTYTASITFGEETVSVTYEIKKAELTVVGATAKGRDYNATSAVEITDIALDGILSSDEVKVDLTGVMGTISSANAGAYTSVTLPVLTLTGTDAGNYTLIQPTTAITTSVTISPLDTIITLGADKYDKTFGDAAFSLDVNVTNSESDVQYSVTAGSDVVSVSAGTVTILKAGTATITVSLPASTNYNAAESKTVTINVAKKTGYTVDTINKSYLYLRENSDSISLAELLPTDCGEVSYGSPVVRESAVFSVAPAISNGVLSYTVGAGAVSDSAQVTVVVASDNYEDFIIQLVVVLTDKLPVSLKEGTKVTLKNNTLTYGETLSKLGFDSVVFVDDEGNEVKGTLAWKAPSTVPNAGTTSASWVFTPNSEEYLSLEGTVSVTVNKATPVIETTPVATAITYGDMLKDSVLTGGITKYSASNNTIVAGSFAWKNGTVKPVVADSGKTAYTVVFTPADTVNYNSVEADIILTINKADNAPNMPESTKNVSNGTKNVGEVALPEGWIWAEADKDKALEIGAAVNATAVYNGEDKGNYENESVVIAITRSACEHEGGTATCKDKAICTLCGEAYGELSKVHSYTGTVTKEPTTEAEGVKTYTCSVCGDSYTEPIPKLDQPGGGSEGGATPELDDKPEDNPSDVPSTEPEYEEEYVYDPKDSVEQHWSGNTGWQKISGEWYYFNDSGKLDTGWVQDTDDSWYYMDENTGKMATGWLQSEESGLWYYMDNTRGNMLSNGWLCDDASGRWYYLNENGAMCTGWIFVDDTWYLLDKNGAMCTGWNLVDGKWYYLDMSGKCLLNTTTPDGYKVDENGVWVTE